MLEKIVKTTIYKASNRIKDKFLNETPLLLEVCGKKLMYIIKTTPIHNYLLKVTTALL